MSFRILPIYLLLLLAVSCSPTLERRFARSEDVIRAEVQPRETTERMRLGRRDPCRDQMNYVPDTAHLDHTPLRVIRINFHYVNSADSSLNYVGEEAVKFTQGWLASATKDLEENNKMWLPHRNNTPVIPTRYRYQITPDPNDSDDDGIYFHFDEALCRYVHKGKNRNLFDRTLIEKYAVQADSVLNIFVMPHHPDSLRSNTYNSGAVGVALGNAIKLAGIYENEGPAWMYRGVLNHEIGHVFGLSHTWAYNDGCADTPRHPQLCWNRSEEPPCDTMASNNVMDYNALQNAWTPCQIGRVHYTMSRTTSRQRSLLKPKWCRLQEDKSIVIRDSIHWRDQKDLEGPLTIERGGRLRISCRVSLPAGAKITVRPGGRLLLDNCRLHNACGQQWRGIEIQTMGAEKGELIFYGDPELEDMVYSVTGDE